jgi:hypothetical protein
MSGFGTPSPPPTSFTPVLAFGGASTGITYTTQSGRYIRNGNQITVQILIVLSSKGSATGVANITGLPFVSRASGLDSAVGVYMTNGVGVTNVYAYNVKGDSQVYLQNLVPTGSSTNLADTNFGATTGVAFTLTYFI